MLQYLPWVLVTLLQAVLLFWLFRWNLHRIHPAFCANITAVLCQGMLRAFATAHWAVRSKQPWMVYWIAQLSEGFSSHLHLLNCQLDSVFCSGFESRTQRP